MLFSAQPSRVFSAALLLLTAGVAGCTPQNKYDPPPPPTVTVALPLQQSVTNYLVETGTAEAVREAEVRARVTGFLEEIKFEAGQDVKQQDVLYVIEQREFQAKLEAAKAELQVCEVDLKRADIEYKREQSLQTENATSDRKVVLAKAQRDAAEAAVAVAAAKVELAQKDMDDTEVRALIDGRIGKTLVKTGNLVDGQAGTQLTTIVQYDPIYANFNISERQLLQIRKEARNIDENSERKGAKAKLFLQCVTDEGFPFEGRFDYAELSIDQSTGTYMVRGVFDNPGYDIIPGMFVRVQIPLGTIKNALLVPEQAIGSDQRGNYVLVVLNDNKVERRNVTLGLRHEGLVVVPSGINADDRVIINGLQRARPGAEVQPELTELKATTKDVKVVTEGALGPAEDSAEETPAAKTEPPADQATPSDNPDPRFPTQQ